MPVGGRLRMVFRTFSRRGAEGQSFFGFRVSASWRLSGRIIPRTALVYLKAKYLFVDKAELSFRTGASRYTILNHLPKWVTVVPLKVVALALG